MLAQIIEEMGYAQVHNSILLINVMIRRAVEFEQKASEYEELRFYPVGHPRKLLIEKRNCRTKKMARWKWKYLIFASSSIASISRRCKQDQINLQRFFAVGNVGGD